MLNEIPPSGPWTGYYVYEDGGLRHRMRLNLTFTRDGKIEGDGVDDIAPFTIDGRFDFATSKAAWIKAYVGMHSVEYSGIYCAKAICGDWSLWGFTGGFWIWPLALGESEFAEEQREVEQALELNVT